MMLASTKDRLGMYWYVCLAMSFILYLSSRVWTLLQYGERAFGYDTGIYKHIIFGYFDRLADPTITPFGFSWFSNSLLSLGISTAQIMYIGYVVLAVLIWCALYYVIKLYFSQQIAIVSMFFFSISLIQYQFFWWYYYRNSIALLLTLVAFICLFHRSYFLIPVLVLIGILHPISLVPIGLLMMSAVLFDRQKRIFLLISGSISLLAVFFISWKELRGYTALVSDAHGVSVSPATGGADELSGQFLQSYQFVEYLLLYLPLSIYGFLRVWKKQFYFSVYALILCVLVFLQVVFYRRLFVWIDIICIIYASCGVSYLWLGVVHTRWKKYVFSMMSLAYVLFGSTLLGRAVVAQRPLVTEEEFRTIRQIGVYAHRDNAYTMVVSPYYAPWVYGFADSDVIAPGMFETNMWSAERWHTFWNTQNPEERDAMLAEYEKPIYIFLGEHDKRFGYAFSGNSHMTHVDVFLWRFDL